MRSTAETRCTPNYKSFPSLDESQSVKRERSVRPAGLAPISARTPAKRSSSRGNVQRGGGGEETRSFRLERIRFGGKKEARVTYTREIRVGLYEATRRTVAGVAPA